MEDVLIHPWFGMGLISVEIIMMKFQVQFFLSWCLLLHFTPFIREMKGRINLITQFFSSQNLGKNLLSNLYSFWYKLFRHHSLHLIELSFSFLSLSFFHSLSLSLFEGNLSLLIRMHTKYIIKHLLNKWESSHFFWEREKKDEERERKSWRKRKNGGERFEKRGKKEMCERESLQSSFFVLKMPSI